MKTIVALFAIIAGACAITNPPITGPTPPAVECPDSLCSGKADGNYEYKYYGNHKYNYFVQCVTGSASCQACWPLSLSFSQRCNQCLYNMYDPCYTTASWVPEKRYTCPDLCPKKGYHFSGNIQDPNQPKHYVGCWEGMTMGCVNCPEGLMFNEKENACLYEGKYLTQPLYHSYQ